MKKALCILSLILSLALCAPAVADSSRAESASMAVTDLQNILSKSFVYCSVYYTEALDRITVRVAVDGLADLVNVLIDAGMDETFESWAAYKAGMLTLYDELLEYVHTHYRDDLTITFHLVSDDEHSRDFISVNGGTKSVFDILQFQSAMRQNQ